MKVIVLFLCCLLAGCCNYPGLTSCQPSPLDCSIRGSLAELQKQGVQVIQTGETFIVVIPSDSIFNPDSANFRNDAIMILEPLVCFLKHHETTIMTINAYTDNCGSAARNRALSERQAQRMNEYLAHQPLDARIIYTRGFGEARPVGDNNISAHRWYNRRIEIKFRKVVLPPLV